MAKRLKIGIDMDDVLVDFIGTFHDEAERVLGRTFPPTASTWEFDNWKISRDDLDKVWKNIVDTVGWFDYCKFFESVPKLLRNLDWSHDLFFITSRPDTFGTYANKQVARQLGVIGIECPTVIVARDKGPIVAALGLDVFIDDRYENLRSIANETTHTRLFMKNMPHNSMHKPPIGCVRVDSFTEFCEKIKELAID